jgi:hypothetical protein
VEKPFCASGWEGPAKTEKVVDSCTEYFEIEKTRRGKGKLKTKMIRCPGAAGT